MKKRKRGAVAWKIEDGHEEHAEVVFCRTRNEAKQACAGTFGVDYIEARVSRAPDFDDVEKLTDKAYIERGWWFECHNCNQHVDRDMDATQEDEEGNEIECDGPIYDEFERAFCSTRCKDADARHRELIKNRKHGAVSWIAQNVPAAIIKSVWVGGFGECGNKCFSLPANDNVIVEFELPGVDYTEIYRPEVFCSGCRHVYLHPASQQLWKAYRRSSQSCV